MALFGSPPSSSNGPINAYRVELALLMLVLMLMLVLVLMLMPQWL
jgi:hypothetical protein